MFYYVLISKRLKNIVIGDILSIFYRKTALKSFKTACNLGCLF